MTDFNNVSVQIKANVYFDGKVTSRKITFADGSIKTLGIMMPGDYEFGTEQKEIMEIASSNLDVLLPGESDWMRVEGGMSFEVPANAKFKLQVHELTDYCCSNIG